MQKIPVMQKFVHRVILYMPDVQTINGQTHINGQSEDTIGYTIDGVSGKAPPYGNFGQYQQMMVDQPGFDSGVQGVDQWPARRIRARLRRTDERQLSQRHRTSSTGLSKTAT